MVEIPKDIVTVEDLNEWYECKEYLGKLKSKEALLRSRIFRFYFPAPTEGTNTSEPIDDTGAVVKGTYVINRSVDIGTLEALKQAQRDADAELVATGQRKTNAPVLNFDELIKWKPEVVISAYRKLTEEERDYFDRALVVKPGSPTVEIVIPKRK